MTTTRRPLPPKEAYTGPSSNGRKPKATAATRDRFGTFNAWYDVSLREITSEHGPWAALIWAGIWRHTQGGTATVSRQYLADCLGCSLPTVKRALDGLRRDGWITVVRRGGPAGHAPSTYTAHAKRAS